MTDEGEGKLKVTYNGDTEFKTPEFTNTYTASGSAQLYAKKASSGNLDGKAFTFILSNDTKALQTKTNIAAGGTATFDALTYSLEDLGDDKIKTFTYYIKEAKDGLPGVEYDEHTETVTIVVNDNGNGKLEVTYNGSQTFTTPVFTNSYEASGNVLFAGDKKLTGREMTTSDVFTFEIREGDKVVATAQNDATGKINYPTITYTLNKELDQTGIHTYTVKERTTNIRSITIDANVRTVTVVVSDNEDGTLKVTPSEEFSNLNFVNTYTTEVSVDLAAKKVMKGRDLVGGEFTFTLTGNGVNQTKTVVKTADREGSVTFDTLKFAINPTADMTDYIDVTDKFATGDTYKLELTIAEDTSTLSKEIIPVTDSKVVTITLTYDKTTGKLTAASDAEIVGLEFINRVIKVQKVDINNVEEKLSGAHFQVWRVKDKQLIDEWNSDKDKPHEITGKYAPLEAGVVYRLHEEAAPTDYAVTDDTWFMIDDEGDVIPVDKEGNPVLNPTKAAGKNLQVTSTGDDKDVLMVKNDLLRVPAFVRKVWDDDNNRDGLRPVALEVELKANGELTGIKETLNEENHWNACVTGLRKSIDGKDIEYTWTEPSVPGYESKKTQGDVLTVLTNTHGPAKTEVSVTKVWKDGNNAAKTRPESIKVQLFADGIAEGDPVMLSAENGWAYTWEDLCVNKNESGRTGNQSAIKYTVAETEIPDGYECKVTGNATTGFVITNSRGKLIIEKEFDIKKPEPEPEEEEETTDFEVEKVWVGDNDNADGNRPESITVRLYAGGQEIKVVKLTAKNGWKYHFGELPKFVDGKPIHYSVKEDPVEGYATEIDGFTIYNKYQPERTQVTVRKVWNDENNKQNKRPTSIWMKLSNGMAVMLNEANGWTATIAGLPTKVNGKPAEYTWTEQTILGYELESKIEEGNVTIFTNKLWTRPDAPSKGGKPKTAGDTWYVFEEYDTPLGVEVIINHVGDCFD